MRQVLALCTALLFTLSLAGAALAQGTGSSGTSTPPSGSSATSPSGSSPSGSSGSMPDTSKSTAPSGTDTKAPKSAAGKPSDSGKVAGGARGQHKMMGEVTKIDEAKGTVSLKTDEGDMDLHFPPSALKGIKEGDRVEVQMAIRPAGSAAGSKTPAKGSSSASGGAAAKPKTTP